MCVCVRVLAFMPFREPRAEADFGFDTISGPFIVALGFSTKINNIAFENCKKQNINKTFIFRKAADSEISFNP